MKFSPGKVEKILITLRIAEDFLEKLTGKPPGATSPATSLSVRPSPTRWIIWIPPRKNNPPRHGLKEENISPTKPKEKNKTDLPTN